MTNFLIFANSYRTSAFMWPFNSRQCGASTCAQVYANGAVAGSFRLTTPAQICGSLVYRSATVLLPTLNKATIPQPK